jgi:hypothetical protein
MSSTPLYLKDVKPGDMLTCDCAFTCTDPQRAYKVYSDEEDGSLYIKCRDGRHYLVGQLQHGVLVGMARAR